VSTPALDDSWLGGAQVLPVDLDTVEAALVEAAETTDTGGGSGSAFHEGR
jgi:hypothetical protein